MTVRSVYLAGLVRSGVAPDHPEVKSVQSDFTEVAKDARFGFLGNARLGQDFQLSQLQALYDAVVVSYGASGDRALGLPGEGALSGVLSARAFVNWYNGHPSFAGLAPKLDVEDVVVIGQGNVAIDCARILTKRVEELATTDISAHALAALASSKVKRVHVIGRRGHIQAAFTMKELRELTKLDGVKLVIRPEELEKGRGAASLAEAEEARGKKRMDALLSEAVSTVAKDNKSSEQQQQQQQREIHLRFFLAPTGLVEDARAAGRVGGVACAVTRLEGPAGEQKAVPTATAETLPAGLVLVSIGYRSEGVPGLPFDAKKAVVPSVAGRVLAAPAESSKDDAPPKTLPGLYVAGWLKRGPSGIIGTNIPDARETVDAILEDRGTGALGAVSGEAGESGLPALAKAIVEGGLKTRGELVSWGGYTAIDATEVAAGAAVGKPREKLTAIEAMLAAAANGAKA